ncbi:peptidyl-tRNA hydrolase isoform X2 [Candoia aspera]|uniref:peptidyl-tRNA hydrolase isoform X2 n=1 Tax=Candoia aspera TaxID=51853 RepID=UPI002FD7A84B
MMPSQPLGRLLRWALGHRSDALQPAQKRVMVAGLGNYTFPGTRHSVGMAVLNHLASQLNMADQWKMDKQCSAEMAVAHLGDTELLLVKPRKFMNLNGVSVVAAAERYNLNTEDIYLVHDDLDKPLGKISLKLGGSARGHNGVRSCISSLRSDVRPGFASRSLPCILFLLPKSHGPDQDRHWPSNREGGCRRLRPKPVHQHGARGLATHL